MNTLIFIAGAGVGILIATILYLLLLHAGVKGVKKTNEIARTETKQANDENLEALKERNRIGEEQVRWLRELAKAYQETHK